MSLLGWAIFSSGVSVGAEGLKRFVNAWDPSLAQYIPDPKPILRSGAWGAVFGATGRGLETVTGPQGLYQVARNHVIAAGATSELFHRTIGGPYWDWMEQSKPFAALYGGYAAAHRIYQVAQPAAYLRLLH
jgi:hypothetical protein